VKLGLRLHPHALRHTLASHLINNDCPPEWIQVLLGHANFASTQLYAKVDMAHLREVADNDARGLL
jgi:integrase/recombinase XerC